MSNKVALNKLKKTPQPNIGQLIKELRNEMELTQEEFASEFGVVFSTVNRWEKGHTLPSPMALKLISLKLKALGVIGEKIYKKHQA